MRLIRTEKFAKYSPFDGISVTDRGPSVEHQRGYDAQRDKEYQGQAIYLHNLGGALPESKIKEIWSNEDEDEEKKDKKKKKKKKKKRHTREKPKIYKVKRHGLPTSTDELESIPDAAW